MNSMTTYCVCDSCYQLNRIAFDDGTSKRPFCDNCHSVLPILDGISQQRTFGLNTLIRKSPLPVVVDFWAAWCGPSHTFAPTFKSVAKAFAGQLVFSKIDMELNTQVGSQFQIRSVPTTIIFYAGVELSRQTGPIAHGDFLRWIRSVTLNYLGSSASLSV